MSLQWYRRPHLVILKPDASALEAARAIERNKIGAVIVQDRGRVAGIITDRDLAVRVLGRALNPGATSVETIMSQAVATLSPSDSLDDVIRLMRERGVRRIPLVEDGRVAGVVTLDDLLLDEAVSPDALAAVVEAQLGNGNVRSSVRSTAGERRTARAEATLRRMLDQVCDNTPLANVEDAEAALYAVLGAILRRIEPQEAEDLLAQLPSLLRANLRTLAPGPDKSITRESIKTELMWQLDISADRAEQVLVGVGATLAQSVSHGELEDVRGQLPEPLRAILPAMPLPSL